MAVPVSSKEYDRAWTDGRGGGGNVSWAEGSKTVLGEGVCGSPPLSFPPPLLLSDFLLSSLGLCKRELPEQEENVCVPSRNHLKAGLGRDVALPIYYNYGATFYTPPPGISMDLSKLQKCGGTQTGRQQTGTQNIKF